jgi:hypothetical protein
LLEADFSPLGHQLHTKSPVRRHVVPFHELVLVQRVVVPSDIQIVPRVGGISLDKVVRTSKALGLTWNALVVEYSSAVKLGAYLGDPPDCSADC